MLGLDRRIFPSVIPPGQVIGNITKEAAEEFGFSPDTVVAAGATDGYVSAVSTGAVKRGDWASIIGTTMVLKGVTKELFVDAGGSSYSHKLPSGDWMLEAPPILGEGVWNDFFKKKSLRCGTGELWT